MSTEFYGAVAGKPLLTGGGVTAFQSFGDQLRWNAQFHSLVVEGGFDEDGRSISVPLSGSNEMTVVFRRRLIWFLVEKGLLAEDFAQNLLSKYSDYFGSTLALVENRAPVRRLGLCGLVDGAHTSPGSAGEQTVRHFGEWEGSVQAESPR